MPKIKLTEKSIAKLAAPDPSGKQRVWWCATVPGFGVVCSGRTTSKNYIAQRDLPGGLTRRVTVCAVGERTLAEAEELAKDFLADMRRGVDPKKKTEEPTLKSALEAYLANRKDLRPASVVRYRQIERVLAPWMGWKLTQITGELVDARHKAIAASIGSNSTRYAGKSTANNVMQTLSIVWNFAAERTPDLPSNPVKWLRRGWYPQPPRTRRVTKDDLPRFYAALRALKNPVARDYLTLLLFSGFRKREAARMLWSDVDLGQRVFHIRGAETKSGRPLQ